MPHLATVRCVLSARRVLLPSGVALLTLAACTEQSGLATSPSAKPIGSSSQSSGTSAPSTPAWAPTSQATKPVPEALDSDAVAAPGLAIGDKAPDVTVTGVDGKPARLADLYKDGPIVLTFYRGGWCPFCTRALSAWHDKMSALKAAGGTFVALTPEKPDLAAKTREEATGGKADDYAVYSDGASEAAKAFKVHFIVDEDTKARYGKFGLKVDESNVSGTWELPAPATFVIDTSGVIRWVFADWDYKKRADPDAVIAAVKAITGRE